MLEDDDNMLLVWEGLTGIYGQKFLTDYGDRHDDGAALMWADALAGFGRSQIHRGLNACATKRVSPFPPTLPEFRALCLGSSDAPIADLSPDERKAHDETEHAYDLAHFRKMRELGAGLGIDVWEEEAKRGIPHRIRPHVRYDKKRILELQKAIEGMLG